MKLALRAALESEAEFVEAEDADEQLLTLLGRPSPRISSQPKEVPEQNGLPRAKAKKRRPGKRAEGRDPTGQEPDEETSNNQAGEERAAG